MVAGVAVGPHFIYSRLGHPPFFFGLAANAFSDIGSVGRIEK